MSNYQLHDLPQIVHQLQVIILASMIENAFKIKFAGQLIDPAEARVQAMAMNAAPTSPEDARKSQEAYHCAIRIWKASTALGLSSAHDHRRMDAETLIVAGL